MSKLKKLDPQVLAPDVPHLTPETLHQLIRHRGLDACGELVASATPAQLTSLLDLDLWHHAPGRDEQFDVERFAEWLEALVDTGESVAARTVAALDRDLVVEGLSRYVRVFDPGIFEPTAQSDDEAIARHDAMLEGGGGSVEREVGGYVVRARRTDAWDAIIALLVALNDELPDEFHALMRGCRRLSNSAPEASSFDDLLMTPEQHLHDVAIEREHRRGRRGYATAADARAFLQMARQPQHTRGSSAEGRLNPIVAAYFRAIAEAEEAGSGAMAVRDPNASGYLARGRELAFLANTLLAGCSIQSRPFTPREASDAAASICKLGLEHLCCSPSLDHDLVSAFEAGWWVLHQDVSMFAATQLIEMLKDLHRFDRDIRLELVALRRALVRERDAGTPWLAREAAEILATLDVTAWIGVRGLLDECPVIPAALTAVLNGSTTTVSPTEFDFISTGSQIHAIQAFMQKLPGLLSR